MAFDASAFLDDFRAEAADRVRDLDAQLLALERDPTDPSPIRDMFLAAHTIKGGAGMLGLLDVRELAHAMEDVLSRLRDQSRPLDRDTADLLFAALDQLRDLSATAVPGPATVDARRASTVAALTERAQALESGSLDAADAEPAMPVDDATMRPARILLIEDSTTVRMLATMQLSDAGFEVDALADGAQALVRAVEDSYDVIVASVETRGVRGFDLAAALRGSLTRKDVPIILLTSQDDPEGRQRAADLGIDGYVQKGSLDSNQLSETARQIVARSQHPAYVLDGRHV
jgi:chemotaxis protein histidine kinase CheA